MRKKDRYNGNTPMKKALCTALFAAACAFAQPQIDWDAVGDQINPYHPPHEHHCTNGNGNDPNTPACQPGPHDSNTPEVTGVQAVVIGGVILAALRVLRKRR